MLLVCKYFVVVSGWLVCVVLSVERMLLSVDCETTGGTELVLLVHWLTSDEVDEMVEVA